MSVGFDEVAAFDVWLEVEGADGLLDVCWFMLLQGWWNWGWGWRVDGGEVGGHFEYWGGVL